MRRLCLVGLWMVSTGAALALPPAKQEKVIGSARSLLGVPYELGGRLRRAREGTDCQGVMFYAMQPISKCGWKSFSVFPTRSIPDGELGELLFEGPVSTEKIDLHALQPADTVQLVGFDPNPAEGPIGTLDGKPVWVWHTGLYSGGGQWIVGDHIAGRVVEVPLIDYLREHQAAYAGAVFTRMHDGPRPVRCRRHAPMNVKTAWPHGVE